MRGIANRGAVDRLIFEGHRTPDGAAVRMAKMFGVRVSAGTDPENPIWHFNQGG